MVLSRQSLLLTFFLSIPSFHTSNAFLTPEIPISRSHQINRVTGSSSLAHRMFDDARHSEVHLQDEPEENNDDEKDEDLEWIQKNSDIVFEDDIDLDEEEAWMPDREKDRRQKEQARVYAERLQEIDKTDIQDEVASSSETATAKTKASPYTEEEEEIISAMGGKTFHQDRKREMGFLGDSTLSEICTDYSVPICYIADVLCMWGVQPPIEPSERLGDLVTGEQAFALLEAVNSLDVAALQDRYSNTNLLQLCAENDVDLQEAFEMAMKEGWSLPFGVQTCLRVEQEDELLRVLTGIEYS